MGGSASPYPSLCATLVMIYSTPSGIQGILVGESPAGPKTLGFLGVKDLEAGSMGEACCNPRAGVFSGLPLLCAVHVEVEIIRPGNRQW